MIGSQFILPVHDELVVDLFAGGGGASTGIEQAIGRHVDIAINHAADAVALHQANHPQTLHFVSDVFEVDPLVVADGRPVGLLWASPDCKHFSKAKGGKPVNKNIRSLAWVVVKWAKLVRPRVICLENVEEFQTWGPLLKDGRPCPDRKGRTFARWKQALEGLGYRVEHRELRACDYGAPTIRKRLFLVARCDGMPIVWPAQTHAEKPAKGSGLKPWRTAAECIDWSLPCPSIFERERPLADATLRRIAHGVIRYVVNAAEPYVVRIGHTGHGDSGKVRSVREPVSTITSKAEHLLCSPTLVQTGYGEREGQAPRVPGLHKPLGTVVAGASKHALVGAFLAKHYTGVVGSDLRDPIGTVTSVDHHSLVASNLVKLRGTSNSAATDAPLATISAQGTHHAEVRAFLTAYYGSDQDTPLDDPLHTVTTKPRFGLVTVAGQQYAIADIGMRMLQPRELYRAQGFPDTYIIDRGADGRLLPKDAQVRMCGNSVCPPLARALVAANYNERQALEIAA
ncbi:MAG: DNA cytosine methyltransferase [Proteobacteria bacterium]|nr:DNA cytosine methyltransferase [Pseudomonadota bacterium]